MKELSRPPLLVALERALGPRGASALDPTVPAALWRRALSGPAAEILARPGKNIRATIVRAGWILGGGAPDAWPRALATTLELLHAGSLVVDDVEDDSDERRGAPALHRIVGVPLAINTGSWMYFLALADLATVLPDGLPLAVRTLVRCHQGQALDLATRVDALDVADAPRVVAAITRLKTGELCALAGELGAIAAGAVDREPIAQLASRVGEALQMLDDLGSLTARLAKGREDLRHARATWPWAWLAELAPDAWPGFVARLADPDDHDALARDLAAIVEPHGRAAIRARLADAPADLAPMEAAYG